MPLPAFSKTLFLKILKSLAVSALLLLLSSTALYAVSCTSDGDPCWLGLLQMGVMVG